MSKSLPMMVKFFAFSLSIQHIFISLKARSDQLKTYEELSGRCEKSKKKDKLEGVNNIFKYDSSIRP